MTEKWSEWIGISLGLVLIVVVWSLILSPSHVYGSNSSARPRQAEDDQSRSKPVEQEKSVGQKIHLPEKKLPTLFDTSGSVATSPRVTRDQEAKDKKSKEKESEKVRKEKKNKRKETRKEKKAKSMPAKRAITYKKHDVNGDLIVNSKDKVAMRQFRNKLRLAYGTAKKEFDLNDDGEVNVVDSEIVRAFLDEQNDVFGKEYTLKDEIEKREYDLDKDGAVDDDDSQEAQEFREAVVGAFKTNDRRYDINNDRDVDASDDSAVREFIVDLKDNYRSLWLQ